MRPVLHLYRADVEDEGQRHHLLGADGFAEVQQFFQREAPCLAILSIEHFLLVSIELHMFLVRLKGVR